MRMAPVALGAVALLATTARADIQIEFPPTATMDTAVIDNLIGVRSYQSRGANVGVSLPGDRSLKFEWSIAPAAGDENYAATGGALIPILPDWQIFDLSAADSVYFDVKADAPTNINIILGSKSLPQSMLDAGVSLQLMRLYSDPGVSVTTEWKTIGLATTDFVVSFFCSETDNPYCFAASRGVNWTTAGKRVEVFNIQPIVRWSSPTEISGNSKGTVYLRNFTIKGSERHERPNGTRCGKGKFFQLDDFAGKTPGQTRQGGRWLAFTDTSLTKVDNISTGSSALVLPEGSTAWKVTPGVGALLTATLEKNVGTKYHKTAGWASVGLSIPSAADTDGVKHGIGLEDLTAISFDFTTGANIDPTLQFDDKLVPAVNFKVAKAGIGDDVTHYTAIPTSAGDGSSICVDLEMLKQPFYVTEPVDFIPGDVKQLSWEMKIEDQKDPTLHTSGPNSLLIKNVKLWGGDSADLLGGIPCCGSIKSGLARNGFKAVYRDGLTVSYKVSAPASVSVARLDGSVVASFQTAAVASNLNLPVSLTRGTYMVVVRGDKAGALVRRIAVSR